MSDYSWDLMDIKQSLSKLQDQLNELCKLLGKDPFVMMAQSVEDRDGEERK